MKRKADKRWIALVVGLSVCISVVLSFASERALDGAGYIVAFLVLLAFIAVGIFFDIIGVAVTTAVETPFHSMASHRELGAAEAIGLLRKAEKVSSVCNDVVGDIAGIVSGATAAVIVVSLARDLSVRNAVLQLAVTGIVSGVTIGGKAVGKTIAINNSTQIVLSAGKVLYFIAHLFGRRRK
ncbi:MAG: hypothetical protein IK136_01175 [Oscillospiraceae bacterium]|nr:hypothetical protein [Oscillospiraceae bacterium]